MLAIGVFTAGSGSCGPISAPPGSYGAISAVPQTAPDASLAGNVRVVALRVALSLRYQPRPK